MQKDKIIGLFLGLFLFILLFPSINQYCTDIGTHVNATDIEVTVTGILPLILIAFILIYACLLIVVTVKVIR